MTMQNPYVRNNLGNNPTTNVSFIWKGGFFATIEGILLAAILVIKLSSISEIDAHILQMYHIVLIVIYSIFGAYTLTFTSFYIIRYFIGRKRVKTMFDDIICPKCKSVVQVNDEICPHCGKKLKPVKEKHI